MTWLWITVFVLTCIVPLTGYIYFIEIRGTAESAALPDDEPRTGGRL
jgi:hypothetical protein